MMSTFPAEDWCPALPDLELEPFQAPLSLASQPDASPPPKLPRPDTSQSSSTSSSSSMAAKPASPLCGATAPCPLLSCRSAFTCLADLCEHVNRSHLTFLRDAAPAEILLALRTAGLSQCPDCLASLCSDPHLCPMAGRVRCPVPRCMVSAETLANIMTHMRNDHKGVQLPPEEEHRLKIGRCRHCLCYFKGVLAHQKKCKKRLGGERRAPSGGPPGAAGSSAPPQHPSAPPCSVSLPGAPPALTWTFGPPGGRSGHSMRMSWTFVPMIRCALGMLEAGGLARFLAGDARWDRWREAYAADFAERGISAASLAFSEDGYLGEEEQLRLLRSSLGGGESKVVLLA